MSDASTSGAHRDTNPFLNVAERQLPAPVKRAHARQEARTAKATYVPTPAERRLREGGKLFRQWKAWHRKRRQELLTGPNRVQFADLFRFLRTMKPAGAPELIKRIASAHWLLESSRDVRLEVLHAIGMAIARVRERQGLPPFDDALPGEDDTAFLTIREMLR